MRGGTNAKKLSRRDIDTLRKAKVKSVTVDPSEIEGAFLTAFSGGIGLAISVAFVTLLAMLPSPEGFDTPRIVPASAVAAIASLAIAGIAAGLYPARKAALLPPVEALRQE